MGQQLWAHIHNGQVIGLNNLEGYALLDDSIKSMWVSVPDDTQLFATANDDGTFTSPVALTQTRARTVDSNEFFAMFTAFEEVGIRDFAGGAKVGDNAQVATARKVVAVLLGRLERAVTVNLDLQANIDGVNFLVSLGLLTPARATEILAGPLV